MTTEWLTPAEVASELDVSARTVQRWIRSGRLPASVVGGRARVSRSSLSSVAGEATRGNRAPHRPVGTLLVANRGEIAVRIARTARGMGLRVVGVHTAGERPAIEDGPSAPIPSYLDAEEILTAARRHGADAVHPGYGFLAEAPAFASAVAQAGLTWVGPPPGAIAAMGDKGAARRRVAEHGVPVLPGYDGDEQGDERLIAEARRIGFPLLVKPAAGGGGKGMRVVGGAGELSEALAAARREARSAFADDRLILERFVPGARHVEVQVLFDAHGAGVHLGERDCSVQRRNQKVLEEAPAPSVDGALRRRMGEAAVAAAGSVGYVGAGTVEFLLTDDGSFHFLEMNTRLQVEHPVTEAVTGRDLVADQLRIAAGATLAQIGLPRSVDRFDGHAIEARLYAEDPEAGFLPATGRVAHLRWPSGPIRIDSALREGDVVSDRFDPLLAKLIAHGASRDEALTRLSAALQRTAVLGARTNLRFLRWLVGQEWLRAGEARTDTLAGVALPAPEVPGETAWRAAARLLTIDDGSPWSSGWRLNQPPTIAVAHGDEVRRVRMDDVVAAPGRSTPPAARDRDVVHVDVEGQSAEFRLAPSPSVEDAARHATQGRAATTLTAPMPGRVLAVRVEEGDAVEAHQPLVILEAMKMEHAVVAPVAGRVARLAVREGDQVARGAPLVEVSTDDG